MSPDAIEVARRTQTAGMRALLYGTVLGALPFPGAPTCLCTELNVQPGLQRIALGVEDAGVPAGSWC